MKAEREQRVIEVAQDRFIRFGFKRTTMGDIAEAAEISRPALYLVYPNKEEILRAVLLAYCEEARLGCIDRLAPLHSLQQRLEAVLETWVIDPFKLIGQSAEAQELYECSYSFASDVRKKLEKVFEQQLTEVIGSSEETSLPSLERHLLTPKLLAQLTVRSTLGLKRSVANLAELKRLTSAMVRVHLTIISGTPPNS